MLLFTMQSSPLTVLILTSLIGAFVVNIVLGGGGTLNTFETAIEVLHGGHVACQEQFNIIPMGQNVHSNAKHFHCSCHATWPPCKTSIPKVFVNVHVEKHKVCAFCVCFSKVSQALLARIIAML